MKQLEVVSEVICSPGDTNYISYCDTDSLYVHAESLLKFLNPKFDDLSEEEKDDFLEEVAVEYQHLINDYYNVIAPQIFNIPTHQVEMKTEAVIRSAYFRATRRYAQWITKREGIKVEDNDSLDIKGLEFKKANFPVILGQFFQDNLVNVLKGTKKEVIDAEIKILRDKVLEGHFSFKELGNPTAIKTLNNYKGKKPLAGEIFSSVLKGAPAPVKASIIYNDLLKFWDLNKKHNYISQGDKIKWLYLKNNPYRIEAIAFIDWDLPDKMKDFIEKYIDLKKIFDSILLNKLENFYDDLGWTLDLNEYKNLFFNF